MKGLRPGVRFMVASAFAFSAMGVCVKLAGARLPSQEIVFFRAVVSLVLSAAVLLRAGVPLWGRHKALLCLRGVFGFAGLSCVFYAVTHLPLAEATVLQYLHPIFTAVLAAGVLGESTDRRLVVGTCLCLLGVVCVTQPSLLFGSRASPLDPFAALVAVGGAFFSACAYVTVRRLSREEHPLVIVFYFPLVTVPASLPTLAGAVVWPEGVEWLWLLGVGVFAQLGQVALTHGMRHEPAGRATSLSYLQVPFAALFGVWCFGEIPNAVTVLGALGVLVGSFVAGRRA